MNWLLLTFLPLKKVFTSNKKMFTAANGQFIIIDRDTYNLIGNHEKFKDQVVEDMEIARSVKSKKKRLMTCVGNNVISTNMYSSFSEAFNGFSKNFYKGFNTSKLSFLLIISILLILFVFPLIFAIGNSFYFLIVFIIVIERSIVSIISKENLVLNILLHPLQMIMMFLIGVNSLSKKKKFWKNRII
jgi:chlorobactene glucosyltransferase